MSEDEQYPRIVANGLIFYEWNADEGQYKIVALADTTGDDADTAVIAQENFMDYGVVQAPAIIVLVTEQQ